MGKAHQNGKPESDELIMSKRLGEAPAQQGSQDDFDDVTRNKGDDAVGETERKRHFGEKHEPDGAEQIAEKGSGQHLEDHARKTLVFSGNETIDECAEQIADDVSAGFSEQNARTAFEAGEDRKTDQAEKEVDALGEDGTFAAQQNAAQMHGKEGQVNGNIGKRDLDLGTDGRQGRKKGHNGKVFGHFLIFGHG